VNADVPVKVDVHPEVAVFGAGVDGTAGAGSGVDGTAATVSLEDG